MANILSKTNITNGYSVDTWHISQSIDAFTGFDEYDITVSGSFTLTGSLKVDGTIFGETTNSSSVSITSSYSDNAINVVSSSLSTYNNNSQYTLQFYAPILTNISPSSIYSIGVGETLTVGNICGLTIPIDSIIISSSIVSSCGGVSSGAAADIELIRGTSTVLYDLGSIDYSIPYSSTIKPIPSISLVKGDRIWLRLTTNAEPQPTDVSHNITLILQPI